MTSEVSTVGPPHSLLRVNGSFVNDASDRTEPPLPSDVVIQRHSQLGGPSLCQLGHQFPCEELGTDRNRSMPLLLMSCRAEAQGVGRSPPPAPAVQRQKCYRHLILHSLQISTGRGDTSHMSFGAALHHKNRTAQHSPSPSGQRGVITFVSLPWQIDHSSHWKSTLVVEQNHDWSLQHKQ